MLFISGSQDKLFPVAGVEKAYATMRATWASQQASDRLQTELWDIPHSCGKAAQKCVLEFFEKFLSCPFHPLPRGGKKAKKRYPLKQFLKKKSHFSLFIIKLSLPLRPNSNTN